MHARTLIIAVVGSMLFTLPLAIAGLIIAGTSGELVGIFIGLPIALVWGVYWGMHDARG